LHPTELEQDESQTEKLSDSMSEKSDEESKVMSPK